MEAQSLYDYLGKPAGPDLGEKVYAAAIAEYFNRKSDVQAALEDKVKILEDKVQLLEDKIDLLLPHFKSNKEVDDLPF